MRCYVGKKIGGEGTKFSHERGMNNDGLNALYFRTAAETLTAGTRREKHTHTNTWKIKGGKTGTRRKR